MMEKEQGQIFNNKLREVRRKKYKNNSEQKDQISKITYLGMQDFYQPHIISILKNGIPSLYRMDIWPKLISNNHGITWNLYKTLCAKANHILKQQQSTCPLMRVCSTIQRDIQRTFPYLKIFQKEHEQYQYLLNILCAWSVFRDDIGYVQGMSQIAGFLVLQLKQLEAFQIFTSLMTMQPLYSYYTFDNTEINRIQFKFNHKLRINNQNYYYMLLDNGIDSKIYLLNWIMTMFTRCFDVDLLGKVWDLLFVNQFEEDFILQISYHILFTLMEYLKDNPQSEDIVQLLKNGKIKQLDEENILDKLKEFKSKSQQELQSKIN